MGEAVTETVLCGEAECSAPAQNCCLPKRVSTTPLNLNRHLTGERCPASLDGPPSTAQRRYTTSNSDSLPASRKNVSWIWRTQLIYRGDTRIQWRENHVVFLFNDYTQFDPRAPTIYQLAAPRMKDTISKTKQSSGKYE